MAQTQQKEDATVGTAVAARQQFAGFKGELELRRPMLEPILPAHVTFDKFVSMVGSAVMSNPELLKCTRQSLLKASMEAAELGLSLNPALKEGDVLPVWNNRIGAKEAQFRPRFMGMMKLARQSGEIKMIYAHVVHANDDFSYSLGLDKKLHHIPTDGEPGLPTHVYCVWELRDGAKDFEVMTRTQVEEIKSRSSAKTKEGTVVGPWITDAEEMWRKTAVRRASKYMPASTDNFMRAINIDNLREVGDEVPLEGAASRIPEDAFDVTDTGTGETEGETQAVVQETEKPKERKGTKASGKLDKLEQGLDLKQPEAKKSAVATITMPLKEGRPDLDAWFGLADAALGTITSPDDVREWLRLHDGVLKNAAFAMPDREKALLARVDERLMELQS